MGSEEGKTNRQIHIEIDSAMRPTACKNCHSRLINETNTLTSDVIF
ncbi:unnamed protein product [Tetraodon nigroviridis]|uniref:(spotted green pufferfish) hypothetical protein n=1 Tax=Tetraodon nigroviridis TaxID=99883 RepID=Q4SHX0_TETNG|nr:unnamed protein product [Tetraodon nigroviridis]